MTSRATRTAVILAWLVVTSVYALWFVTVALPPGVVGYERDWDFRLLVFAIVRLPLLLIGLGIGLGLASWWVARGGAHK